MSTPNFSDDAVDAALASWLGVSQVDPERQAMRDRMRKAVESAVMTAHIELFTCDRCRRELAEILRHG